MNILYTVLDWGLGHATRSLPLIAALRGRGHGVDIASSGSSLVLLRQALPGLRFHELPVYPSPYRGSGFSVLRALFLYPRFRSAIREEHRRTLALARETRYDRVISDGRYGCRHPEIPSYLITHQLRLIAPGRFGPGEYATELFNAAHFRAFTGIIVPDAAARGLCGDLAHDLRRTVPNVHYPGHLTDMTPGTDGAPLDCFISLSGPEPQRTRFEELIRAQTDRLSGRISVALARPGDTSVRTEGGITWHGCMDRPTQADHLRRARLVITRSGYTTLMELAELGKKALLVPTPGQTEQEYLAKYVQGQGWYHTVAQQDLDLGADPAKAMEYPGYMPPRPAAENVRECVRIIEAG